MLSYCTAIWLYSVKLLHSHTQEAVPTSYESVVASRFFRWVAAAIHHLQGEPILPQMRPAVVTRSIVTRPKSDPPPPPPQNHDALIASGAAFGPLQEMMASSNPQAQMAGVQFFASLCERDTYGGGGGVQTHSNAAAGLAAVSSYIVRTPPHGQGHGGLTPGGGHLDPTMEFEDPEEALAKVRAPVNRH